ncbi:MAG: hemolysin family protein [Pseudomonadota bacterium]
MSEAASKSESDSRSGIWASLRALIFGNSAEPTLREQIEEAIDEAEEDGGAHRSDDAGLDLSRVERDMLRNMLAFGGAVVDDVAVPRADIIALDEKSTFAEAVALLAEADHSRIPVYREKLDDVVGMIHVKDLFGIMARGETPPARLCDHPQLIRQPLYVPQSMLAMALLAEMRAKRTHLAIVLDEYGGTDGLVTIEDLVEEIVGDIEDEHDDAPEQLLIQISETEWEADARIELEELSQLLDPRLAEVDEDVDTLGGLAFVIAGHVPQLGEILDHSSGWQIKIIEGDERRITRARLSKPQAGNQP